jgi:hypothetical protein
MDIEPSQMMPIPFETRVHERLEQPMPPYNGFGTVEDSIGSCKYLVLKPPKKDFMKILENGNKVLRFVAKMVLFAYFSTRNTRKMMIEDL